MEELMRKTSTCIFVVGTVLTIIAFFVFGVDDGRAIPMIALPILVSGGISTFLSGIVFRALSAILHNMTFYAERERDELREMNEKLMKKIEVLERKIDA